ncbi:MAG: shikimate kinase [Chlamydiota bacterium]|nr:shikimate kinase [Chlamydiota bacterium]
MNVYLFGFMGTGKSTVGRLAAKEMGLDFVDMDKLIEEREGMSIKDIFQEKGEPFFRKLETELIKELVQRENILAATGGGVIKNQENVDLMQQSGCCICLNAAQEVILQRVSHSKNRPLLLGEDLMKQIQDLLNQRKALYAKIDHQVDTSVLSIQEVVQHVIALQSQHS